MFKRLIALGSAALLTASSVVGSTNSALAADGGNYDGNPTGCTSNWVVGAVVPVKASDGRTVGWSAMYWSNSCQANWTRAWTADGSKTTMESTIFQSRPPGPDRRFAIANDYGTYHFTMYVRAGAHETMCAATQMWDPRTLNWAFTGTYCRT